MKQIIIIIIQSYFEQMIPCMPLQPVSPFYSIMFQLGQCLKDFDVVLTGTMSQRLGSLPDWDNVSDGMLSRFCDFRYCQVRISPLSVFSVISFFFFFHVAHRSHMYM